MSFDRSRLEAWLSAEAERLILWVPVAFGLGIAAWFALPGSTGWLGFWLLMLGVIALGVAVGDRAGRCLILFGLIASLGLGHAWWRTERVAAPRLARPMMAAVEGEVTRVEHLTERNQIRLWVKKPGDSLPPLIRFTVAADTERDFSPGEKIRARVWLMPPPPLAPGGYDFRRVAWFEGLGATGRALGAVEITGTANQAGWRAWLEGVRSRLTRYIEGRLLPAHGGIAAALVTGDQGGIPDDVVEAMRDSGLAHLLSISGLHVSAVVGFAMLATRRLLALSPWLVLRWPLPLIGALGAAAAGIAYTMIAGAGVPTVRACLAALVVLIGIAIGREAISLRTVAAGALFIMLIWPEAIVGPSFQLSFAAVTAIIALYENPRLQARFRGAHDSGVLGRLVRGIAALLATGIVVELALSPIALFHFNQTGLYGAFANIVAIPWTTFVVMPVEALALLFDLIGFGAPFWWLLDHALGALIGLAQWVAAMPGATALLPTMPNAAFAAMVAGGLWICLWRTQARWLGVVPALAGAALALMHRPPDLLVTGDGRHLAWRSSQGDLLLLRDRAGEFTRDMLGDAGASRKQGGIAEHARARCSADLCLFDVERGGRRWRIAATRSTYFIDRSQFEPLCARSDIIVSDRALPSWCRPRWLKLDRRFLATTGALAIRLNPPAIDSVTRRTGSHPWGIPPQ